MDLNLDNYTSNELLNLFQLPTTDAVVSANNLQNALLSKIEKIKQINGEDISVSKENIIEFYTRGYFKIINDINIMPDTNGNKGIKDIKNTTDTKNAYISEMNLLNMNEIQERKEYRDAYNKNSGNVYETSYDNPNQASINIQSKMLPKIPNTHTLQESNNFVTKHEDYNPVSTFNSNLKAGIINPLVRKSMKKNINVNTRFRNNYFTTISTNFTMDLPFTIKKVISMRLINIELPSTIYNISSKLGSNYFKIDISNNGDWANIIIKDGIYTSKTITHEIQEIFDNSNLDITISYNEITSKIDISHNKGDDFIVDFNYDTALFGENIISSNIDKNQLTLGWILGFRGDKNRVVTNKLKANPEYCKEKMKMENCTIQKMRNIYCETNSVKDYMNFIYHSDNHYVGECTLNENINRYYLLSINDFQNNNGELIISPFKEQTLANNNILAKIVTSNINNNVNISYPERIYFGPTNISKFQIVLYDEFSRIVDVNNSDYSFTIELETLYDL